MLVILVSALEKPSLVRGAALEEKAFLVEMFALESPALEKAVEQSFALGSSSLDEEPALERPALIEKPALGGEPALVIRLH
jgi:hypothetical protein